jgi:protein involved in polysaccharide export with SLBB domain
VLSFVPLFFGILSTLPATRLTDGLQVLSNTWTSLLTRAPPWRSDARESMGQSAARGQPSGVSWAPSAAPKGAERGVITYGDRLKITFFESLGVTLDDSGAKSDHVVATVFPRMDLSAEYAVDEGGSVNIPKLGQFATAGQTITALQSEVAAAFQRALGRTSDVHVAIVERQPVYVLGTVRNAGTFKFTPGMTVLQALGNAGGVELGGADTSKAIESIRETERLNQAQDRFYRLNIKHARLVAERENSDTMTVPASSRRQRRTTL